MTTLDDIRAYATALPGVEEKTHFGRPGFRVNDKLFVNVDPAPDSPTAILSVGQEEAAAAVAADPAAYEEMWREHGSNRIFVGLRVDLTAVSAGRLRELVQQAWRYRAPKRLVAELDQRGGR